MIEFNKAKVIKALDSIRVNVNKYSKNELIFISSWMGELHFTLVELYGASFRALCICADKTYSNIDGASNKDYNFELCITPKQLTSLIKVLKKSDLEVVEFLTDKHKSLIVQLGKFKAILPSKNCTEYDYDYDCDYELFLSKLRNVTFVKEDLFISGWELEEALRTTLACIDTKMKDELSKVRFVASNSVLYAYGTNRCSASRWSTELLKDREFTIYVDQIWAKHLQLLLLNLGKDLTDVEIHIQIIGNDLYFGYSSYSGQEYKIRIPLSKGIKYPMNQLERLIVIPKEVSVTINRMELISAVNKIPVRPQNMVKLVLSNNKLLLGSFANKEPGELYVPNLVVEVPDVKTTEIEDSQKIRTVLNKQMLLTILKSMKKTEVILWWENDETRITLKPMSLKEDGHKIYLIMPIQSNTWGGEI